MNRNKTKQNKLRSQSIGRDGMEEGREDRKSLRHMYVTLKYGDGVCAANSIRQDFQCGHDELI